MKSLILHYEQAIKRFQMLDGIPPLLLRLYLAPVFMQAGWTKFQNFDNTVAWFGNSEWGLGLPLPELMVTLAAGTELIGGAFLVIGLCTRLFAIPLAITMAVAALTAHWSNGWLAIADPSSWFANGTLMLNESVMAAADKKAMAIEILKEHGNYEWLTSSGSFTILNNGIEFAATYFIMAIVLLFSGGGRFTSIDYYLKKELLNRSSMRVNL